MLTTIIVIYLKTLVMKGVKTTYCLKWILFILNKWKKQCSCFSQMTQRTYNYLCFRPPTVADSWTHHICHQSCVGICETLLGNATSTFAHWRSGLADLFVCHAAVKPCHHCDLQDRKERIIKSRQRGGW